MTALSETAIGTDRRLADLPLVIESYSLEGLSRRRILYANYRPLLDEP
jgi:hypothetical protein